MGIEFLKHGKLFVDRTHIDKDQLLAIKNGKRDLESIKLEAGRLQVEGRLLFLDSKLPMMCDINRVEEMLIKILIKRILRKK